MRRVVIESPYGSRPDGTRASEAEIKRNINYLHLCIFDCLRRGESPYASHGFFTAVLRDALPDERALGIQAGLAWAAAGEAVVVYTDLGKTPGMMMGIDHARRRGQPIEERTLEGYPGA